MERSHRLVVVLVALVAFPTMVGAQGIGDASKKEKSRRQQAAAPKAKTYTQDDLAGLPPVSTGSEPGAGAASSSSGASSDAGRSSASSEAADPRKQAETRWRTRAAEAEARVERARKRYETFSSMNLVPGYVYQDAQGRTVIHSVEELQKMTADAKAELAAAEKAQEALFDEARRANVPPGWLR